MPPGHLPGEETPGQTKDTLERLYLSACLEMSWRPAGGVVGTAWGEECLGLSGQAVAPATRIRISGRKQNKTKKIIIYFSIIKIY